MTNLTLLTQIPIEHLTLFRKNNPKVNQKTFTVQRARVWVHNEPFLRWRIWEDPDDLKICFVEGSDLIERTDIKLSTFITDLLVTMDNHRMLGNWFSNKGLEASGWVFPQHPFKGILKFNLLEAHAAAVKRLRG